MKKLQFKTIFKTKMADTDTPVSLYLRFRDVYVNTLVLESSDYHSKEESFSFIAIEPIVSMKVDDSKFSVSHKLTLSATLKVKSGLSTLNKISGLNFNISSTVLLILFLILKILSITLVNPR